MAQKHCTPKRGTIMQIDEASVKKHLGEIVKWTVQETLNNLLDEETARLCNAEKYKRTDARKDSELGIIRGRYIRQQAMLR
jgi:putative transposase